VLLDEAQQVQLVLKVVQVLLDYLEDWVKQVLQVPTEQMVQLVLQGLAD
jgi:hypothetical protein